MTENEAIESLKEKYMDMEYYFAEHDCYPEEYDAEFQVAMATAMKALKEIQQYRVIGTVEECREARERQRSKEPIILSEQSAESEGKLYIAKCFKCPTCGNTSTYFGGLPNNCHNCGQSLESDAP